MLSFSCNLLPAATFARKLVFIKIFATDIKP